jgi:hypothetical protein
MRLTAQSTPHTIRFPADLYTKLHILANESGRTFNGAVIYLLQIGYTVMKKYEENIQKQIEVNNVPEATSDDDTQNV